MREDHTYTRPCFYCGSGVDPSDQATYRRVVGWERKAVSLSRKGGSDIVLREPRDEFACFACVERLKAGVDVAQASLI